MRDLGSKLISYLSLAQGFYFLITGVWPLVGISSFQMVTGRKTDLWLVKTVGVLVSVIGGVLIIAGLRRQVSPELLLLAVGSGAGLIGIDVVYVASGRISRVYLIDALIELIFIAGWILVLTLWVS